MSEKLCLKWNDFQDNVNSAFGSLHKETEFADVTLACDDGQQIEAHKVILAASSPFFQKLLRKNKHPHPLIFIMGMKSEDLIAIVDFLYCGETRIHQENIDSFLAIAEQFELKGFLFQNPGQDIKSHGPTIKVESEPITRKANNLETVSEPEPTRLFSKEQKSTSESLSRLCAPPRSTTIPKSPNLTPFACFSQEFALWDGLRVLGIGWLVLKFLLQWQHQYQDM